MHVKFSYPTQDGLNEHESMVAKALTLGESSQMRERVHVHARKDRYVRVTHKHYCNSNDAFHRKARVWWRTSHIFTRNEKVPQTSFVAGMQLINLNRSNIVTMHAKTFYSAVTLILTLIVTIHAHDYHKSIERQDGSRKLDTHIEKPNVFDARAHLPCEWLAAQVMHFV